jgi:hypothetical protein
MLEKMKTAAWTSILNVQAGFDPRWLMYAI